MIDPTKNNFSQSLSVKKSLDELVFSKDNYYRTLLIPKIKDLELHLKGQRNSCLVNNSFDLCLKTWQTNIDIQPVFNEHEPVTHMYQYFSNTGGQCSQAMKQAAKAKGALKNNRHYHDTMKIIAKAYLTNRECSAEEAVYHILPKLKLRRIFLASYFVNNNLPEERVQVLLSEKELRKLPDDSPNNFKKENTDRYMERTIATFCNEKYSVLDDV